MKTQNFDKGYRITIINYSNGVQLIIMLNIQNLYFIGSARAPTTFLGKREEIKVMSGIQAYKSNEGTCASVVGRLALAGNGYGIRPLALAKESLDVGVESVRTSSPDIR
jgi:hypothetical protein